MSATEFPPSKNFCAASKHRQKHMLPHTFRSGNSSRASRHLAKWRFAPARSHMTGSRRAPTIQQPPTPGQSRSGTPRSAAPDSPHAAIHPHPRNIGFRRSITPPTADSDPFLRDPPGSAFPTENRKPQIHTCPRPLPTAHTAPPPRNGKGSNCLLYLCPSVFICGELDFSVPSLPPC